MELFQLIGRIAIDGAEESSSALDEVSSKAKIVGDKMSDAGETMTKFVTVPLAGAMAGIGAFALKTSATADNVDKMSQKIGISREAYQELDFILSQSGASVDSLQAGMKSLTSAMDGAKSGTASNVEQFERLGVAVTNSDGTFRSQEDVLFDTLSALQGLEDQTEKSRLATELFGRSGTELMPLLNGAEGSIEAMKEQAHDLGLVLTDEAIDSGVEFTDTIDQLKRSFASATTEAGSNLLPKLTELAQLLIEKGIPAFEKIIDKVTGVVEWFFSLDESTQKIIGVIGGLIIAMGPVLTVVGKIISLAGTLLPILAGINPVTILIVAGITAVVGIGVALYKNWDTIKAKATELKKTLEETFSKIKESVVGAFESMWDSIKGAINNIIGGFETMVNGVVSGVNVLLDGISKVASAVGSVLGLSPVSLKLAEVTLPKLAKGGVLEAGQIGLLEGDGAEAVVPLDQNKKWISSVSQEMNAQGIGGGKETIDLLKQIAEKLDDLVETLPDEVAYSLEGLKLQVNNREFGRMVRAVT